MPDMLRAPDGKTLASKFYWQAPRPPASPLSVADQTFVLGRLSFRGLFQAVIFSGMTCLVDADSKTMSGLKELHLPLEVY